MCPELESHSLSTGKPPGDAIVPVALPNFPLLPDFPQLLSLQGGRDGRRGGRGEGEREVSALTSQHPLGHVARVSAVAPVGQTSPACSPAGGRAPGALGEPAGEELPELGATQEAWP